LGIGAPFEQEIHRRDVSLDGRCLLCSEGLSSIFTDEEIASF
jgi:serine/threonine protein phosphatase PrpC